MRLDRRWINRLDQQASRSCPLSTCVSVEFRHSSVFCQFSLDTAILVTDTSCLLSIINAYIDEKEGEYDGVDDGYDGDLVEDLDVGNQSPLLPSRHGSEGDDDNEEERGYHSQSDDSDHEDPVANHTRVRVHVSDLDKRQSKDAAKKMGSAIDILDPGFLAHRPP